MMIRQHKTHMLPCPIHRLLFFFSFFLSFVMMRHATYTPRHLFFFFHFNRQRGVQPTPRVVNFFLLLSIDDAACNLHAALSISFFYYQLTTRCATYMPHRRSLFCYQLMMWRATYTLRHWFLSFTINRQCGVQPTCHVINLVLGSSRLNTYIVYIVCL
jgi:hypothetical protein